MRAYCSECGEQRSQQSDLKLSSIAARFFGGSLNFENTFWKTVRMLLFRPGQLTLDHSEGRRVGTMRFAQLFLFCNVLFFFAQPLTLTNTLDVSLETHLDGQWYSQWARSKSEAYLAADKVTQERIETAFAQRSSELTRSLVVLLVPMMSLVLWAAMRPMRRRAGSWLFFGFEFVSFLLLGVLTLSMLAVRIFYSAFGDPRIGDTEFMRSRQTVTNFVSLLLSLAWTIAAVHRLSGSHVLLSVIRGAIAAIATVIPYWTFRFIIFILAGSSL